MSVAMPDLRPRLQFISEGTPIGQAELNTDPKTHRSYWANSKVLMPWRKLLARDALLAMDGMAVFSGPVFCVYHFALARPVKPRFELPILKGRGNVDLDHAERSIGDALSGVVWDDDAQIVNKQSSKRYAGTSGTLKVPGVSVAVFEVLL